MIGAKQIIWIEHALRYAGLALLLVVLSKLGYGWFFQSHSKTQVGAAQISRPTPTSKASKPSVNGQILGELTIPRLNVSTVIVEGDDDETLDLGIGHMPGTALGGISGNTVLAAHRDTYFRCLRKIKINDEITLAVDGKATTYRISGQRIVKPDDVSVLQTGDRPQLTLITCYPFGWIGPAPNRLVVTAEKKI